MYSLHRGQHVEVDECAKAVISSMRICVAVKNHSMREVRIAE